MIPTREIYWNVAALSVAAMYLLLAVPAFFLAYGITRRYLTWRLGKEAGRVDRIGRRLKTVLVVALLHRRILRPGYLYAGLMHLFIFWGFVVLFLGTLLVLLQADITVPYLGLTFLQGNFYVAYKLVLNLFGLLLVIGVLMALYRRYVQVPPKLKDSLADDALVLWILLALGVTGFLLQALRLAASGDPYGAIHWVSYPLGLALAGLGTEVLQPVHTATWWFHMAATMLFLAYVAFSKMFHILAAPAHLLVRPEEPRGALPTIPNIEEQESLGAGKLRDFDWKQLLNVDACTRCARCLDYCPTYNSDKPLKPRQLLMKLAAHMATVNEPLSTSFSLHYSLVSWCLGGYGTGRNLGSGARLIGEVISEEEIWDCTTCRACTELCPVMVEPVPLIVEMRRHLVMEQSRFPSELVPVFNSLERRGNPYRMPTSSRADWAKGLEVPLMAEVEDPGRVEVLWWVGCTPSYETRAQKTARAFAAVLRAAGVGFAILGPEEACCGDPARRAGHEHLYQMLVQQNVEILNGYQPRRIVTSCPHCFNTLKNEYPRFGGNYEVVHHSQLLSELLVSGRLRSSMNSQPPGHQGTKVARREEREERGEDGAFPVLTYHDPCYLGRYNDVYDDPRAVLERVAGGCTEMPRIRDRGFCCGSGGAHAFMDERRGTRISHGRVAEAMATGAGALVAACPFCVTALLDGVRALDADERFQVLELSEVVAATL